MEIKLQNIGIVNSTINLDGLTVITGENNSGKTTVGKVVYSLIDAVSNLQSKARNDKINYIQAKLAEIESTFQVFRYAMRTFRNAPIQADKGIVKEIFGDDTVIEYLFSKELRNMREDLEDFAYRLYEELKKFDFDKVEKNEDLTKYLMYTNISKQREKQGSDILIEMISKALMILEKLFQDLERDADLIDYARENINQTLRTEFASQIQPVFRNIESSSIQLTHGDLVLFQMDIKANKVVDNGKPVFISSPYNRAYLIDDPFILDEKIYHPYGRRFYSEQDIENSESYLNTARIRKHDEMLSRVIRFTQTPNVFEEIILNKDLMMIKSQINKIIPGEFDFGSDGEYYVVDGKKLRISNLATGSKMFSIIKILLEKGVINDTTMLVLDEPEAHLHPSWQNKFAEIIVLLVKELNTNILLTTHSPNFMLAIDAYMRKYEIESKTNFYQTTNREDEFIEYRCVNEDMGVIYADFMKYLSEVKVLRDNLV